MDPIRELYGKYCNYVPSLINGEETRDQKQNFNSLNRIHFVAEAVPLFRPD
jgi:hypothetical protein